MKIDFKSPRKISFPINIILFNLIRLWPFRNKRIWIFGGREGTKFDDNSKFLYEYINSHSQQHKIKPIWMTNDDIIIKDLSSKGYSALNNNSWRGKWIQLRAGVAVYSHGLIDFGVFPLVAGSNVVSLWHGVGLKKIYNAKYNGVPLMVKKFLDYFFSWTYRNQTMVTSLYTTKWAKDSFSLNPKKISITGQPRNDVFKTLDVDAIKSSIGLSSDERFIIFMPTYRQKSLGENAMTDIVTNLYNSKELDDVLTKTNSVFVCKLHPLTPKINQPARHNFRVLDYAAVNDNQALMGAADILVTDYSSCFVDYALLNRPIVFYTPDEEIFISQSEAMEKEFWRIKEKSEAKDSKELAEWLLHPTQAAVDATKELFEDPSIKGTCYCENVYNAIIKEIGL